jgi:hypothetical protein
MSLNQGILRPLFVTDVKRTRVGHGGRSPSGRFWAFVAPLFESGRRQDLAVSSEQLIRAAEGE